ncbi:MAG: hypothetical protein ACTSP4_13790 [Candidatus Hodarchaeales archaeon]
MEMKKRVGLPGSRIYYYINQLIDNRIIEETGTEKITEHMSRRKFKISDWFLKVLQELDSEFHSENGNNRKSFHLFQIYFAIMVLKRQARLVEKIPGQEYGSYIKSLDLPFQQFFFLDDESLPVLKENHGEMKSVIHSYNQKYSSMVELMGKSSHIAIYGIYSVK